MIRCNVKVMLIHLKLVNCVCVSTDFISIELLFLKVTGWSIINDIGIGWLTQLLNLNVITFDSYL